MTKIKKLLAFILASLFIWEAGPGLLAPVYGNTQYSVAPETTSGQWDPALRISSPDDTTMRLLWQHPVASGNPDSSGIVDPADKTEPHKATGYYVFYRNATQQKTYGAAGATVASTETTGGTTEQDWSMSTASLLPGSLYALKVQPYHKHRYQSGVNANNEPIYGTTADAPTDTTYTPSEAIYLTNIDVSATGVGNSITVTWQNPTWNDAALNNAEIFAGFRIYYAPAGSLSATTSSYKDVLMSDSSLTRNGASKTLQYTVTDSNVIKSGQKYDLMVEPLSSVNNQGAGVMLRNLGTANASTSNVVTISGRRYAISFTSQRYTATTSVKSALYVTEVDGYVRVSWDAFSAGAGVQKILIQQGASFTTDSEGNEALVNPETIGTLQNANKVSGSADIPNFWLAGRPDDKTYYQIIIYYYDDPTPYYSEVEDFDPQYGNYRISKPIIWEVKTPDSMPVNLDIYWEAFWRRPVSDLEKSNADTYGNYLDKNVEYDIWVTDDWANFDKSAFLAYPVQTVQASSLSGPVLTEMETTSGTSLKMIYNYKVTEYVDSSYEKKTLEDNKLYYVRIVARRPDTAINDATSSDYAYWTEYILLGDPVSRPLMISKPPLALKETTVDSITIKWYLKWYEAYNKADNTWYSLVGIKDGKLLFGEEAEASGVTAVPLYGMVYDNMTEASAKAEIRSQLSGIADSDMPALRLMDLTKASYEIHVAEFDYVEAQGGYDTYYNAIEDADGTGGYWQTITPSGGTAGQPEYTVGTLQQDTDYVIYFRPYTMVNGRKVPYYPNYIYATTDYIREPIDIIPTVPVLEENGNGDTYLRVKWEYNDQLEYQLAYGELLTDYSTGGTVITWADLKATGTIDTENGKTYFYYTVDGLFPDTPYYLWLWAIAKNSGGDAVSAPSNPTYMVTLDIQAPPPPNGLSLASRENVKTYNTENSTEYIPSDSDYTIVEWLLNSQDGGAADSASGSASGSGPATGLSNAEWLSSETLKETYLARFAELTANKRYFFRAKTILTVTKNETGIEKVYNYVVQISDTEDFTDYVEIIIPPLGTTDPVYTKQKESGWTNIISIVTGMSNEEYDGNKTPDQYLLPSKDFEITHDLPTDTLTFRFRTNQTDADGNQDNNVDQRFISRLLQNRTYVYDVDLSKHKNNLVTNRVVELPYSIFAAFSEHKISLRLIADNLSVTLPAEAVLTSEVKELSNLGYSSTIKISLTANPGGLPDLFVHSESYASTPQKLGIQVITPTRSLNLSSYGANIQVAMKLSNRYLVIDQNVGAYQSTPNVPGWERMNMKYDDLAGTMDFQTIKAGTYAVIARNAPMATEVDGSYNAMYNVTTKLNIKDLAIYNPLSPVNSQQFNNLVAAVAKGSLDVYMNNALSNEDSNSLGKSRLLVNANPVIRDVGINALVHLYELKTGSTIRSYSDLQTTAYPDIAGADPAYQAAMLKAGDLGFYGDSQASNPKYTMELGELLYMLDIIMQDSGM